MLPFKSYIICTSPRSGSTLLCRLLAQTGRAGCPESYFHQPSLESWLVDLGLPTKGYPNDQARRLAAFKAALKEGAAGTGIFGLRLQRHAFGFWTEQLGFLHPDETTDAARIAATFGDTMFIHLTRENKLDQAISFVKAEQSGLWHMAPDGTEIERLSAPQKPRYDAQTIAEKIDEFTRNDTDWRAWFAREKITPLTITYDQLSDDPAGVVAGILRSLGVENHPTSQPIPVAKLADATNRDWAARFLAERG